MRNPKATMLCSVLSLLLIFGLALLFAHRDAPAAPALPPTKHFLEVGKTYRFRFAGTEWPLKVLEEPRDNWVKLEYPDGGNKEQEILWINLNQVTLIWNGKE
jgi:hypothetical protein